ncbi:hypothetical protein FGO68_gene6487 [Halteria grandinella]|uniref:Uncharacterized protein n=1 Tax=Halteria grandinella TaxID=5974 RepID=A0A8J8SZS0_HALGN|nr:hypothetical protein FGO68_gene6487 [Halteria grandinella]
METSESLRKRRLQLGHTSSEQKSLKRQPTTSYQSLWPNRLEERVYQSPESLPWMFPNQIKLEFSQTNRFKSQQKNNNHRLLPIPAAPTGTNPAPQNSTPNRRPIMVFIKIEERTKKSSKATSPMISYEKMQQVQ